MWVYNLNGFAGTAHCTCVLKNSIVCDDIHGNMMTLNNAYYAAGGQLLLFQLLKFNRFIIFPF